jgi:hypothetical protein
MHDITAYGNWKFSSTYSATWYLKKMGCQLDAPPALTPGKEAPVLIE